MLKKPMGRLFTARELESDAFLRLVMGAPLLVSVGDRVTESINEMGRTPDVQVVDMVERRARRGAPPAPYEVLIRAENPPGEITGAAIAAVRRAVKGRKPARVLIDGEEDLLTIPAVVESPPGSLVCYGQPKEGVVAVQVDERSKASAKKILDAMLEGARRP